MTQNSILILILLMLISACSAPEAERPEMELLEHLQDIENLTAYPADVEPLNTISLTPNGSYESFDDVLMGNILDVEVDDQGRVFLEDVDLKTFHIINPDRSYVTRLGRDGQGPGEFSERGVLTPKVAFNKLYIYDNELSRISVFDLETLTLSHTIDLNPQNWNDIEELSAGGARDFYVNSDSTILLKFVSARGSMSNSFTFYYFNINDSGERISDIILQQQGPEPISMQIQGRPVFSINEPYQKQPLLATTGNGRLVTATTGEFLINLYQPDGESIGAIYYPIEEQRLNRSEVLDSFDSRLNVPSSIELPEFWPVLHNYMVTDDENRLWVPTIVEESEEVYQWWVLDLDRQGELMARFEWPRGRSIEVVKNGFVYTIERDQETAIRHVNRYRIELNKI